MIPGIVLAAGMSSRMGQPKANLPVGGAETFLSTIVRTLHEADIDDVVVVVGHDREAIVRRFAENPLFVRFMANLDYRDGQLSSLLTGLRAVDRPGVSAALVTLVDVPFVSTATVRAVLDRYRRTRASVVRPVHNQKRHLHGHPLVIDRQIFDELRHASPLVGAKPVIRARATPEGDVDVADIGAFTDIDTAEEYERALSLYDFGARVLREGS